MKWQRAANGKELKDAQRGCTIAIELVGYKPCAILAASWWVSGDGQCLVYNAWQ
jgi:hypothetical protein